MTVTATPIYGQTIVNAIFQLTNSTSTTQTLVTAGTNGTKIEGLFATSTDTSARDLTIQLNISSTNYGIAIVSIPITAGTVDTVPSVNLLRQAQAPIFPLDSNGNPYIYLASGTLLTILSASITSGKVINVTALGYNF